MPVTAYVLIQTEVGKAANVARRWRAARRRHVGRGRDRALRRDRPGRGGLGRRPRPHGGGPDPAHRGHHPHGDLPGGQPLSRRTGPRGRRSAMAPAVRSAATSLGSSPQSPRASSPCWPGLGGGRRIAPGVPANRGQGAGWTTPATSVKVSRDWLWGWSGASAGESTGAAQASVPSKIASHSSRVLVGEDGGEPLLHRPATRPGPSGRAAPRPRARAARSSSA